MIVLWHRTLIMIDAKRERGITLDTRIITKITRGENYFFYEYLYQH